MNPDPSPPGPGDDLTAIGMDADVVDALALEAVAEIRPDRGTVRRVEHAADAAAIVRRFRDEAPALAAMARHPDIVGVLDAGIDDEGRAYLVMESVEGRPILEDADDRRLDVPARLRLFARACDALEFAHRLGVIHRDLGPDRILVTPDGEPRWIGLGLSRVLDPGADGPAPEYTAPEQVVGEPRTTAGDVYAMGVVLYHLLTGRSPYRVRTGDVAELFQAICEQAPERPSRAVRPRRRPPRSVPEPEPESDPDSVPTPTPTPAAAPEPSAREVAAARGTRPSRLSRALAGDLDAIVMMAMRQEPGRRYASASQLADDLRAHLDGRPVRARAGSSSYRLRKWARRKPWAVVAAMAVSIAIAAGIAATARGLVRANRRRDRAEASAIEARRAVDGLVDRVFEDRRLDQPGLRPIRRDLLRDARGFYEGLAADRAPSSPVLDDRPGAQGRLGRIAAEVAPPAEAEAALRRAVAMWEDVLRDRPDDPEARLQLARALGERARVLRRLGGRRDEALDDCRRAAAALGPIAGPGAPAPPRRELGSALLEAARIESESGRPRAAIEDLGPALAIAERLAAEDPSAPEPRIAMAAAQGLLARILVDQPDGLMRALVAAQLAAGYREEVVAAHPDWVDQSYQWALDLNDLSVVQQRDGKLDSALASARRAIEVLEPLDRQHPDVLDYALGLGRGYNLVGELHRLRGEPDQALASVEKARDRLDRLRAAHPDDVGTRVELARSHAEIGRGHRQANEPAEALRSLQRAVDLLEGLPRLGPRESYDLACDLALCIPLFGAKPGTQGGEDEVVLSKGDQLRRRLYGDRAVEVLREAARGGAIDAEALRSEPDLAAISGREDFRALMQELEKPAAGKE